MFVPLHQRVWILSFNYLPVRIKIYSFNYWPATVLITGQQYYDIIKKGTFYINSDEQFESRSGEYWKLVQTYQHFTRSIPTNNIFTYSFALDASSFQPNGFLNFAPYVRTMLSFEIIKQTTPMRLKTTAVCLNWLTFDSGAAHLKFN